MSTGNGKIANLPSRIREEINWRINDGQPGTEIIEWLNAKPEVMEVLSERFDGHPISEQNLSEWRKRGYQQWLTLHVILDESDALSKNVEQVAESGINCEKLLLMLAGSYAVMIQRWNITPMDEMNYKMNVFRDLTNAVLALRRAELQQARIDIARERLELLRERQRAKSPSSSTSRASSSPESAASPSADLSPFSDLPVPRHPASPEPPPPCDPRRPQAPSSGSIRKSPPFPNSPTPSQPERADLGTAPRKPECARGVQKPLSS